MSEAFLYFLWQYQLFDFHQLQTQDGERIQVIHPGYLNRHSGPDFSESKVVIGSLEWMGHVEIHVRSSDWVRHKHQYDPAYNNVILHVVWEADRSIQLESGEYPPCLELKDRISPALLERYRKLLNSAEEIPCANYLPEVNPLVKMSMQDKMGLQRLEERAETFGKMLDANKGDWRQTTFQLLAGALGGNVNKEAFHRLSDLVPIKYLLKHRDHLHQVEALLYGAGGFFVQSSIDDYQHSLATEYASLGSKFRLHGKEMLPQEWKFGKMRPPAFPTLRIAQLAMLVHTHGDLCDKMLSLSSFKDMKVFFSVRQSSYWEMHHRFGKESARVHKGIGNDSLEKLVINAVCPLFVLWGKRKADSRFISRALELLEQLPTEVNRVTKKFVDLGFRNDHALDSQSLLQLDKHMCQQKKCLSCNIGVHLLKRKEVPAI